MRKTALLLLTLASALLSLAQSPKLKYGKITPEDLAPKAYTLDSGAQAIVLFDIGKTEIVGNSKGGFSLEHRRHCRMHVLSKGAYDHAVIQVPLYTDGDATEKLEDFQAITYNLEGGKVVETKMDRSAVFTEKQGKHRVIKKFSLPNIREGSVFEYSYRVESDFLFNLQPWDFQDDLPHLWSEYTVAIPQFLEYAFIGQGYQPYELRDKKDRTSNFSVSDNSGTGPSERVTFSAGITEYKWGMKNVPALREESFVTSLRNHNARLEFQLAAFKDPLPYRQVMSSWPAVTQRLRESEDFGQHLSTPNNWLDDAVRDATAGASSPLQKAEGIYRYVRDHTTATVHSGKYLTQTLKNVWKTKNGNVADINLLLTAMLRHAGLEALPVILSTRGHGYVNEIYPLIDRFNYVIVQTAIGGKTYHLDASHPRLGFGRLPSNLYNGQARVIDEVGTAIYLQADSLRERKVSVITLTNNDKGFVGRVAQSMGYFESFTDRDAIAASGKEGYLKSLQKSMGNDISLINFTLDSLDKLELPMALHYEFLLPSAGEDILYINPLFGQEHKENPFKSPQRFYPVEMPYTIDETTVTNMELPAGYAVDEIPKSTRLYLNEAKEGYFEYLISATETGISLRSRLKLERAYFQPEEYEGLREFFAMVVAKQAEQIVLKKKTSP